MAPEVIEKGSYDSSADWFSLGCMLMKLLNGYVRQFPWFPAIFKSAIFESVITLSRYMGFINGLIIFNLNVV